MTEALARLVEELAVEVADRAETILRARLDGRGGDDHGSSEYLTVQEASELLRAKRQRIYDLLSAGRLTRYRDGSRVLVSRQELEGHLRGVAPRLPRGAGSRMATGVSR